MPTITFEPPATVEQGLAVCKVFGVDAGFQFVLGSPKSIKSDAFPCDLTLDPTKPETWARAVYEAGKRDQWNEIHRRSLLEATAHADSKIAEIDRKAGTAQQPSAPKPERTRCQYCDQWDDKSKMDVMHRDGWAVYYAHKPGICDVPAKTIEQRVADLEKQLSDAAWRKSTWGA